MCSLFVPGEKKAEITEMEEENSTSRWRTMSPEIVEIREESVSVNQDQAVSDVFVAVGENDLEVVKWAVDHAVSPGARVYLVHVYHPFTYIRTLVGKLSRSQLSKEQLKTYVAEENNRRRTLLQKYIRLCTDAKVAVETMLLESNTTAKAILDLIPIVNIANLVMGTRRPPPFRLLTKGQGKGEFVQKNAPEFCEVTIIYNGKKVTDEHQRQVTGVVPSDHGSRRHRSENAPQSERKFFECTCFSGKFD